MYIVKIIYHQKVTSVSVDLAGEVVRFTRRGRRSSDGVGPVDRPNVAHAARVRRSGWKKFRSATRTPCIFRTRRHSDVRPSVYVFLTRSPLVETVEWLSTRVIGVHRGPGGRRPPCRCSCFRRVGWPEAVFSLRRLDRRDDASRVPAITGTAPSGSVHVLGYRYLVVRTSTSIYRVTGTESTSVVLESPHSRSVVRRRHVDQRRRHVDCAPRRALHGPLSDPREHGSSRERES